MLDTDGMGAVLAQNVDGVERVVAYASRALSRTEKKYCAMRREMLALVCYEVGNVGSGVGCSSFPATPLRKNVYFTHRSSLFTMVT